MIRFLKGIYEAATVNSIIVETDSGIGFEINIPKCSPLFKYDQGDTIKVYTQMIVKEDDMSLYGFHNLESLDLFNLLTTVNGIGPKAAMSIMGTFTCEELKRAIFLSDIKEISKAPGIGKKTAERLCLELKDKVGDFSADFGGGVELDSSCPVISINDNRTEAISALVSLGYSRTEAFDAVSHIIDENLTVEAYIKNALKRLF